MHRYAREAYEMGIRFIGGCCGFEPYHIRALSEEVKVFPLGNLINIHFSHANRHMKFQVKISQYSKHMTMSLK